ncbi:integral membrane protein [Aspergillus ellipticus CBS 707.79]|uniref:Integral membrane protein n=1 Tax=Aspergillus ellipticus CBS 707.79 TaxID=1448320 RepID=A0A319DEM7_9EURO|nr:integral membrane protein [Aspergillus ellipticus CBS 707.79]
MKLPQCLLTLWAALVVTVLAASNTTAFPECAISCLETISSTCSITDASCVCTGAPSRSSLVTCAESNCTTKEYYTTRHQYEIECNIKMRSPRPTVDPSTIVPLVLATIFFFIRIAAKVGKLAGGWGPDDYTITIAWVLGIAMFAVNTHMIELGFGQDIWDIPFNQITLILQYFEGLAMMYKTQISLSKISVLLFLLRIFQSRAFRTLAYTLIAVNASIGITFALVDLLRCTPVKLDWVGWTNEYPGSCVQFNDAVLVHCLVNIVVDVVIVCLPVFEVSKLQLPTMKKVTVALMFMMGLVLTVIAIIRAVVFWDNRMGANETAGLEPLIHWSIIESQIAILTTCLPAARAFLSNFVPGMSGSADRRTRNTYDHAQSGGNSKISKSVNISVDYTTRSARDSTSAVHLVEMDGRYERF